MEDQPQNVLPPDNRATLPRRNLIILVIIGVTVLAVGAGWFWYKETRVEPTTNNQLVPTENKEGLRIVAPKNGTIVKPGEIIYIKLQVPEGIIIKDGIAILSPLTLFLQDKTPPYEFKVKIPENQDLGPLTFSAIAKNIGEDEIVVNIEIPEDLVSINVEPSTIALANTYSPSDVSSQEALRVTGVFVDSKQRDITLSSKTKYLSHDENIASVTIGNPGSTKNWPLVRGVKAGKTAITISYNGKSIDVPVLVQSSNSQPVAIILPEHQGSFAELPPVKVGTTVMLDGSKSYDPDGDPLTFEWGIETKPVGSKAVIIDADKSVARIIPDKPGHYSSGFWNGLIVKDNRGGIGTDAWGFDAAPVISLTKSTLSVSPSRVPADGKTKSYITVTIKGEDELSVTDTPLVLFSYLGTTELPWKYCKELKTDAKGQAVFEVFTEVALGPTKFFAKAGGCRGLKIEQEVTIDFY